MSRFLQVLILSITAVVLMLFTAACASTPDAEPEATEKEEMAAAPTVKIGVLLPFTGPLGEFGAAFQKAAALAGEHLAQGGYPVEIVYGDTETNPTAAVGAARKLVDVDQVHVVVGAAASSSSLAVAESVTIPKGVPQISYASTSPLLTILPADEGQDFLFRTVPSDALQGVVLAGVAVEQGYKNVAIIYVNNPYGQGLKDNFQAAFEAAGGTVSAAVPHDEAVATTYVAELRKAIEGEPEVLLALSYAGHATIYLREAIENDFITKFLFVDGTRSEQIIEAVGAENLEGMMGTAPGSAETQSLEFFKADYQAKYGELPPLPFMTNVYDSIVIAALAALAAEVSGEEVTPAAVRDMLRTVSNPDGDVAEAGAAGVKAAIEALRAGGSINYEGAAGAHDFDASGDVVTPIEVWRYAGGTIESVRTEEVTLE
jgi:branched-chain amino acid transport system substrate-binding protein